MLTIHNRFCMSTTKENPIICFIVSSAPSKIFASNQDTLRHVFTKTMVGKQRLYTGYGPLMVSGKLNAVMEVSNSNLQPDFIGTVKQICGHKHFLSFNAGFTNAFVFNFRARVGRPAWTFELAASEFSLANLEYKIASTWISMISRYLDMS